MSGCTGNTGIKYCFSHIPEACLSNSDEGSCGKASCYWCRDHCIEDSMDCPNQCGNGYLEAREVCDDGNVQDGDGCPSTCYNITAGWRCLTAGQLCTPIIGDGLLVGTEACDDGNVLDGDGCSASGTIEAGWECDVSVSPTVCTKSGGLALGAIIGIAAGCGALVIAALITGIVITVKVASKKRKKREAGSGIRLEPQVMAFVVDNGGGVGAAGSVMLRPGSAVPLTSTSSGSILGDPTFTLGSALEAPRLPTEYTGSPTPPGSHSGGPTTATTSDGGGVAFGSFGPGQATGMVGFGGGMAPMQVQMQMQRMSTVVAAPPTPPPQMESTF
jgi:cysteine-rich repeat protein